MKRFLLKVTVNSILLAIVSYFIYAGMSEHQVRETEARCQRNLEKICGPCRKLLETREQLK